MKQLIAVSAVLLAASLAAQPLQQGRALIDQGHYAEAKRLLAPYPNDAASISMLGEIAMSEHNAALAKTYFEKAIALKPKVAEYHFHLGEALGAIAMEASIFKQASMAGDVREAFEEAVALDPNYLEARFGLIDYYTMAPSFMGGSQEKAVQQAAEIRKRDSYLGHRAFVRVYTRQKKFDLARKEWQTFVREQPQSAISHSSYGVFLAVTDKKIKEGFEEMELAVKLDPTYMPAWFRLGQAAAVTGAQLPRGEEALRKYLGYKPKSTDPSIASAHYYLGMVLEKEGKKAEAKQSYANALKLTPGSKQITEALKRVS
jgi:Tfp pilus assembly protein PilF